MRMIICHRFLELQQAQGDLLLRLSHLARSPHEDDVFTESKPHDHTKEQPSRSHDFTNNNTADIWSLPTLPTLLASDSSGSSISTLATPALPSPAPCHIRRAQGRLSSPMPTPTPTPSAAEPNRCAHARMSLMFPIPTPGSASGTDPSSSRAAYRKSLDLSELARCRLWDRNGRENVRVRDKENMQWQL